MNISENYSQKAATSSIESFDAAIYIADQFYKGAEPDSYMSVSEWADAYQMLSVIEFIRAFYAFT